MPRTIQHQLPDGWTATYKIGKDRDGIVRIVGLTVEPADFRNVPRGGLTATRLRQVPMSARIIARTYGELAAGHATYGGLARAGTYAEARDRVHLDEFAPRRGKRDDLRFLKAVAEIYLDLLASDVSDVYDALADELRRRGFDYGRSGARELVRKARQRNVLTETSQGRPGGELTREPP